jgi:hypothetical protein
MCPIWYRHAFTGVAENIIKKHWNLKTCFLVGTTEEVIYFKYCGLWQLIWPWVLFLKSGKHLSGGAKKQRSGSAIANHQVNYLYFELIRSRVDYSGYVIVAEPVVWCHRQVTKPLLIIGPISVECYSIWIRQNFVLYDNPRIDWCKWRCVAQSIVRKHR